MARRARRIARDRRKAQAKQRAEATRKAGSTGNVEPPVKYFDAPRVELTENVDLSKAKSGCMRCHGTGIRGAEHVKTATGTERIPIICRCVSRNGGVKLRGAERITAEVAKRNAEAALDRIAALPEDPEVKA